MRVITASIFAIVWACVHATNIASLEKFKAEYATLLSSGSTSAQTNAAIMGAAEPTDALMKPLWRWYRAVDAPDKGLAKQVMDQAASHPLVSSALALANFKTTFDTGLTGLNAGNAATKWPQVTAALGDTLPVAAPDQATWTAYQALSADEQAIAKSEIMEGKFVKLFTTAWQAISVTDPDYKTLMAARANTINVLHQGKPFNEDAGTTILAPAGLDTNKLYSAVSESVREQMVRVMG